MNWLDRLPVITTRAMIREEINRALEAEKAQSKNGSLLAQYVRMQAEQFSQAFGVDAPDPSIYEYFARTMQNLSYIYTAVSNVARLSASWMQGKLQVMELQGEEKIQIKNHEFEQLHRHPNEYQFDNEFEFIQSLIGFLTLNQNCYVWLNSLDPSLPPAEMYILRPDRTIVIPDPQKLVAGYKYTVGANSVFFPADEVIHFKGFHPSNDWYGLSPIQPLSIQADTAFNMQKWNRQGFAKSFAKPQGILAFADDYPQEDWDQQKADLEKEHGGVERRLLLLRNAGKGGVQFVQTGFTQRELEYAAGLEGTKADIWQTIAPGLWQVMDKNATYSNAQEGKATLIDVAIYPNFQLVAAKYTSRIMPRYGENLVCEFEDIRHRDRTLELDEQEAYAKVHTLEETRRKYYSDDPLGDERDQQLAYGASASPPQSVPEQLKPFAQLLPGTSPETLSEGKMIAMLEDLKKMRSIAIRRYKDKRIPVVNFESKNIPLQVYRVIRSRLAMAESLQDVKDAFREPLPEWAEVLP